MTSTVLHGSELLDFAQRKDVRIVAVEVGATPSEYIVEYGEPPPFPKTEEPHYQLFTNLWPPKEKKKVDKNLELF